MFDFFFNDTATTEIYTLSLHDALPISFGIPRFREDAANAPNFADFTEENFKDWWFNTGDSLILLALDPIGNIQANFFVFLILIFLAIIFVPLGLTAWHISRGKRTGR